MGRQSNLERWRSALWHGAIGYWRNWTELCCVRSRRKGDRQRSESVPRRWRSGWTWRALVCCEHVFFFTSIVPLTVTLNTRPYFAGKYFFCFYTNEVTIFDCQLVYYLLLYTNRCSVMKSLHLTIFSVFT